jgi:LysM repeat protein
MASWQEFQQAAQKISNETGFPVSVILGQAALETGRGTSNFSQTRNNWFGLGAYDSNPQNAFRFSTPEESIRYYINTISKLVPDWKNLTNNPQYLVQRIRNAGYATDPNYVQKVTSTPEFQQNINKQPQQQIQPQQTVQPGQVQSNPVKSILNNLFNTIQSPVRAAETYAGPLQSTPTSQYLSGQRQSTPTQSYVAPVQQQSGARSYTVQPGDTLWGIAQKYLGSGSNYGKLQGYTGDPRKLPIGTKLTY